VKYSGAKADLDAVAALVNKAEGRPKKGVRVGGGIHAEIAEAFTPGAAGWLQPVREAKGVLEAQLDALVSSTALDLAEKAQAIVLVAKLADASGEASGEDV